MNSAVEILRILPELVLTLTGVAIVLIDASLPRGRARRPLGWLAAAGALLALWASLWQLALPSGTAFSGAIESSPFTVFFHALVCGVVLATTLLSMDALPAASHHQGEYYALTVFSAVGMCLMSGAVELLLAFLGLEISSIATYVLCGYRKEDPRSVESALKYFLLGSFATAFLLYGVALLFGATGSTHMQELAQLIPAQALNPLVWIALPLLLTGLLFKVSAAPFHVWTPDVIEGAPLPVAALVSTAPKAAAFALLLRVLYQVYPSMRSVWEPLLLIVATLSMTVGNLAALRQRNIKRMLGYSAIAQAGYLLTSLAAPGSGGLAAAAFYASAYAAMGVGVFAAITLASGYEEKITQLEEFRGFLYRSPALGAALIFFLLSLTGIPFTGGFFAKFYAFSSAAEGGALWLAAVGLLNSCVAAGYYLRFALAIAQRPQEAEPIPARALAPIGVAALATLALAAIVTLWLGIYPNAMQRAARISAQIAPALTSTLGSASGATR